MTIERYKRILRRRLHFCTMATIPVHRPIPVILIIYILLVNLVSESKAGSSNKPEETRLSYEGSQILRIRGMTKEKMNYIHQLENERILELLGGSTLAIEILVLKDRKEIVKKILKKANMTYGVVMDDVSKIINITSTSQVPQFSCSKDKDSCLTWTRYHRLEDIYNFLEYLEQMYPEIVSVEEIGFSAENRALKLVKVSNNRINASKSIWIDGGIHAREWISPACVTFILNEIVERFSVNSSFSDLDFYFMPVMNPDGYEYSHTVDRFWRKNRAPNKNSECIGTDLNRNWGHGWGGKGASNDPCSWNFSGEKKFSEKETASVAEYIIQKISNLEAYVSYHSYGQYILFPWAHTYERLPDYADLLKLGVDMAKEINKTTGAVYKVGTTADKLYVASGGSDDWARGAANIKYSYTVELQDTGDFGFLFPPEKIGEAAKDAYAVFKTLMNRLAIKKY